MTMRILTTQIKRTENGITTKFKTNKEVEWTTKETKQLSTNRMAYTTSTMPSRTTFETIPSTITLTKLGTAAPTFETVSTTFILTTAYTSHVVTTKTTHISTTHNTTTTAYKNSVDRSSSTTKIINTLTISQKTLTKNSHNSNGNYQSKPCNNYT